MAKQSKKADDGSMPLTGHLRELRNRILVSIAALIIGILLSLAVAKNIVRFLTEMGLRYDYHFVYLAPQELLLAYFQIALIGGVILAVPVIAYEVYAFCSPALEQKGRMTFILSLLAGGGCFALGVFFAYKIILPFMLRFLVSFSIGMEVVNSISIGEYLSFVNTVFIIFGVVFEMPVVSVLLSTIGVIRAEWLARSRKVMIVVIFFVAAIITPPDVVSQVMVAVPMIGLFELSIVLSRLVGKRKRQVEAEDED